MSLVEFKNPDFLEGQSARAINQRMMAKLPDDLDKVEGGFIWDMLMPSALEKSELLQYHMVLALKTMFHMWAEGRWLDYHAHDCGLERRAANKAYGYVTVTGELGVTIPEGFVFSVPSDSGEPAIDYATLEETTLPEEGTANISIEAVEAGKRSNVTNDKITIMRSPMKGIAHITNPDAVTGGAEAEDDDTLRQRIDDALAGKGDSFVGNNADYVRWAMEVPGVGFAHTIPGDEYHGPNSVKVVVTDMDGLPANEQILQNVHLHIWGTHRKDPARLAPTGVIDFAVAAPAPVEISYSFRLKLKGTATEESVKAGFEAALLAYYRRVATMEATVNPVKYVEVSAVLLGVAGVDDFKRLRINGGLENIVFQEDEFPVTGKIEVELYE